MTARRLVRRFDLARGRWSRWDRVAVKAANGIHIATHDDSFQKLKASLLDRDCGSQAGRKIKKKKPAFFLFSHVYAKFCRFVLRPT